MISVRSQVVEAQDLELLDELYPWIERSRLDQRADAESLLCLTCQLPEFEPAKLQGLLGYLARKMLK